MRQLYFLFFLTSFWWLLQKGMRQPLHHAYMEKQKDRASLASDLRLDDCRPIKKPRRHAARQAHVESSRNRIHSLAPRGVPPM
jgi:hypothetical protein